MTDSGPGVKAGGRGVTGSGEGTGLTTGSGVGEGGEEGGGVGRTTTTSPPAGGVGMTLRASGACGSCGSGDGFRLAAKNPGG